MDSFSLQDCEDHALLLCSLLLGFGLDAYVCVGTKGRGSVHSWVMTISTEGLVTFWESLTGHRYVSIEKLYIGILSVSNLTNQLCSIM